jgi:hypothetical protein
MKEFTEITRQLFYQSRMYEIPNGTNKFNLNRPFNDNITFPENDHLKKEPEFGARKVRS